jgi:hypothetical protein
VAGKNDVQTIDPHEYFEDFVILYPVIDKMPSQIEFATKGWRMVCAESSMKCFIAFPEKHIRYVVKAAIKSSSRNS